MIFSTVLGADRDEMAYQADVYQEGDWVDECLFDLSDLHAYDGLEVDSDGFTLVSRKDFFARDAKEADVILEGLRSCRGEDIADPFSELMTLAARLGRLKEGRGDYIWDGEDLSTLEDWIRHTPEGERTEILEVWDAGYAD